MNNCSIHNAQNDKVFIRLKIMKKKKVEYNRRESILEGEGNTSMRSIRIMINI